ncbi:MAG TPA: ABC transporter permease [Candidatus Limnocylindria bacterium]|jgi:putative spermidine/putrescine transport system permease protein
MSSARAGTSRAPLTRRFAAWLHPRRRLQLTLLLTSPLLWIGLAYLGSLGILLLNAFWHTDAFSGKVIPEFSLDAFGEVVTNPVYRTIALRTLGMAVAVTVTDVLLGFPIAYYMARVASRRTRRILLIAVLLPLWASYLVKIYSWRVIFQGNGLLDWLLEPFGISGPGLNEITNSWVVLSYLWLPYMILPIFAGLERIPESLLEASSDLGGRAGGTFRRIVLPLALPAIAAGSIFTFSLTLGDYITPTMVSGTKFIGNVIYDNSSLGSLPLAAAYSFVPIVIMVVYLFIARRMGAFESL